MFNELNNEDLKTYLAEKWHDLSPIDISSSFRNDELLKKNLLFDPGADIDALANNDRIPLHMACQNGNESTVRHLINQYAVVNL